MNKIIFEADTRNGIPVRGGAVIRVDDYEIATLSLTIDRARIASLPGGYSTGDIVPLQIAFLLNGCEVSVQAKARVTQLTARSRAATLQLMFDRSQRALAERILSGGELDDIVDGAKASNAKSAAVPVPVEAPRRGLRVYVAHALVGIALTLAALVAGSSLFKALFVITPSSAALTADLVTLGAPAAGQLRLDNPVASTISLDQKLGAISERPGSSVAVLSPCDCAVLKTSIVDGTYLRAGQPIAVLLPDGKTPVIEAMVTREAAGKLLAGATAAVTYADGSREKLNLTARPEFIDAEANLVSVRITPGTPKAASTIGEPVEIEFSTFRIPKIW